MDRNSQVGWTDGQWNRVREEILREWQRVRVAGSFLPIYDLLPPSTQVVPSESILDGGVVDDTSTIALAELSTVVTLSRQQVIDDDLSDALVSFRRAANAVARGEDAIIFKGQELGTDNYPNDPIPKVEDPRPVMGLSKRYAPVEFSGGNLTITLAKADHTSLIAYISNPNTKAAARVDYGSQGLANTYDGPNGKDETGNQVGADIKDPNELVSSIVTAISYLEDNGYGQPFVCALTTEGFTHAYTPFGNPSSLVLPADRIEPLIGRKLVHASALNDLNTAVNARIWGIVVSLAGSAVDLVVAVEATAEFTQIDRRGRYEFRVFERVALRVKDNIAIVRLYVRQ